MARKGTLPANVLKFAASRANDDYIRCWRHEILFAAVHVTDDNVRFCDGPECLYVKLQSHDLPC